MMSDPRPDFPFYADVPVVISPRQWAALMAGVAAAFLALALLPFEALPESLLPKLLFAGIPLGVLASVAGRHWTALFRSVRPKDCGIMVLMAIGAMTASAIAALVVDALTTTVSNPLTTSIVGMSLGDYAWTLIPTAPQLLGEELLTLLPFLAILWLATQHFGASRTMAIWLALIVSTALFAAAHLPTYNWQFAQCFGVIGAARVVLTLSYIWTRNLWVPVGAHIINDWTEFTFIFSFGHVRIDTP